MRAMPAGCIFADKGPAAFAQNDNIDELLALLATANSRAFKGLVDMQMAFGSYEVGVIQRTPVPRFNKASREDLAKLARRAWSLKRFIDTPAETSHAFVLPALLQVTGADLAARATVWAERVRTVEAELAAVQVAIDERCFEIYGIGELDRRFMTEDLNMPSIDLKSSERADEVEGAFGEDTEEEESVTDPVGLVAELVSWAVGIAFGRFDVRIANGERPVPTEPEPFDPLPLSSPGLLAAADGIPLLQPPTGYSIEFPENGVLADDPGHVHDLTAAIRVVFDVLFGASADGWWNKVSALLDPKDHHLRGWLTDGFFEHHVKRYSKSRRKSPLFWQLSTPSGRYGVWLYAHRLTRDSFFQIQNEVVGPKLMHEERQLASLIQIAGTSPSASERKDIAKQEALVEDLRTMLDEVKRIAPLWKPNLDDGVVLTMAPLWRLVPQHKVWQKELKGKWDELAAGTYDWAHVAMHLWPERVVPKCAKDRSLAIAHDLEDIFWSEGKEGKWVARPTPTRPIEELVRERTSSAVNSALRSHLEAPVASANGVPKRGRRAYYIASDGGAS
jgi:hypothetical protein